MAPGKKTDNAHLGPKLHLRRYFLQRYHSEAGGAKPYVLDCCQGEAVIWTRLRSEFSLRYWGVDRKPRRGRLAIDSARLLESCPLPYDVIDIDTYGSPWKHWLNALRNIRKPTTVFLTLSNVAAGGFPGGPDRSALEMLGLGKLAPRVPPSIRAKLTELALAQALASCYNYSLTPIEAREAVGPGGTARYFGVRLAPTSRDAPTGPGERHDGRE